MDPVTMAGFGLGGLQAASAFQQAEIIRRNADLKSQVDDMNAQFAELDAYKAEQYGYTQASRYGSMVDQTVGEERSKYADQNVDVGYGTAAQVQKQSRFTGYLNEVDMIQQAREKAMGLRQQAESYRLSGSAATAQGALDSGATEAAGLMQGGATSLSGYKRKP